MVRSGIRGQGSEIEGTSIARELSLPVRFAGVGEQMAELLEFSPADFVDSLLG
jgi:signal recognition particle GTPase